jgi:hypothetical protein
VVWRQLAPRSPSSTRRCDGRLVDALRVADDPRRDDDHERRPGDSSRHNTRPGGEPAPRDRQHDERHEQHALRARQGGQPRAHSRRDPRPDPLRANRGERTQQGRERERHEERLRHQGPVGREKQRAHRGESGREQPDTVPRDAPPDETGERDGRTTGEGATELRGSDRVTCEDPNQREERRIYRRPRRGCGPGSREYGRIRKRVVLPDHATFEEVPGRVDAEMQVTQDDEVVHHPQDRRRRDHECEPEAEGARPPRRAGHGRGSYGDGP